MRCLAAAWSGCPQRVAISVAALIALTGCAATVPPVAGRGATAPVPGTSAPASGTAATAVRCTARNLRPAGGREGENETAIGFIEFTNTGSGPCMLRGYPRLALIWHGRRLSMRDMRPRNLVLRAVVLAPGKTDAAQVMVQWQNWCGRRVRLLSARITIPGTGTVTMPFNGPPDWYYTPQCVQPGQPSELWVMQAYASS